MGTHRIVSFRIDPVRVAELDSVAKLLDRDRSHLINEAVDSYLEQQRSYIAMVKDGLRASKNGETIGEDELNDRIDSWVRSSSPQKPKRPRGRS